MTETEAEEQGKNETRYFDISTGGWSGNEEILGAMRRNILLWRLTWEMARRGGHYRFRVAEKGQDKSCRNP